MKVISTNISNPQTIFNGKKYIKTGIFKKPVQNGIFLGKTDVKNDSVVDRKYHGGVDKACYLYSTSHYPFWKEKYPKLDWNWGMFGENLSIEGLDESSLYIGDTYKVGNAIIQVSEPRRPCNTLGLRFNSKTLIREFLNAPYPGTYVRVLQEGNVSPGDELKLQERPDSSLTVAQVYALFSAEKNNEILKKQALELEFLSQDCKNSLIKK